jgi:glycosyltransferase involved in cell wall biosynthesis
VGRKFPAIEAWHCRGNLRLWRQVLDRYELHQVACGYALTGLPQALCDKRYVIWVASSMDGDKEGRRSRSGLVYRLAQSLQIRELRRLERLVLQRAAWVLAVSPYTRAELLERGARADRLSVLPVPIDVNYFKPAQTPPSCPTVLWLARHHDPRKNTPLLLRAFARLVRSVPNARLLLAGEGKPQQVDELANELNIRGHVEFLGPQPNALLPSLYRQASVFAIPSDQEGLGIVGLEAMASGLPVVSTRCGGPEAYVLPGKTGFLVDINQEGPFAEALSYLLTHESDRLRMGEQSRRLVEEQYTFDPFVKHLREVYSTVWPNSFPQVRPPVATPQAGV